MTSYKNPAGMSKFNKPADYVSLNSYSPSLGVPIISSVNSDGSLNMKPNGENHQLIPVFSGVSYTNPNYNSLTDGGYCNTYPSVSQGYKDTDCVKFWDRPCSGGVPPGPKPPKPSPIPPGPKPGPYGPLPPGPRRK